ncbi:MAG: hypothetical protein Q9219_004003 [cf. Caloplaca sp. 3 TL-2023]
METFEARLQSFDIAHTTAKKRTSNAKGTAKLKWPHKSPNPTQLAQAGFYYNPTSSAPDNTTCYVCHSNLDGWEEDDSAVGEHINLASDCGWAAIVRIEQEVEEGNLEQADPMAQSLLDARKMTFGAIWPHDNKRGWLCKTQKLKPRSLEHQKRSPDCLFFQSFKPTNKRSAREKKGRASNTSRMSTQSNTTTASKEFSLINVNVPGDDSLLAQRLESVEISKPAGGGKKGVKGKKVGSRTKRKASDAQQADPVTGSSFVEPEDDSFEVKITQDSPQKPNRRKRKSNEISLDGDSAQVEIPTDEPAPPLPSAKRRATRSSVSQPMGAADPFSGVGQESELHVANAENAPPHSIPVSKSAPKFGRKRASTTSRKASATSTASKASLRATVPDDEEIDAVLEADLDRPLTDDEVDPEPPTLPKAKTRRLTRTRPGPRKMTASTAPARKATRASALPVDHQNITCVDTLKENDQVENIEDPKAVEIALTAIDHAKQEIIAETDKHMASKVKSRGRPPAKSAKASEKGIETVPNHHSPEESQAIEQGSSSTDHIQVDTISDPKLDQPLDRPNRISEISTEGSTADKLPQLDRPILAPIKTREDFTDEAPHNKQNRVKKTGKAQTATGKKGKASKKGTAISRNMQNVVHVIAEDAGGNGSGVVVDIKIPGEHPSLEASSLLEASKMERGDMGNQNGSPLVSKPENDVPPTEDSLMERGKPVESLPIDAQKEAATGMVTPAASQSQDEARKTPPVSHTRTPLLQETPKMAVSPQSSDIENQPPSSRPSALRPPLLSQTSPSVQNARLPLIATTPTASPSKRNISRLQTTVPWEPVDFERIFGSPSADKENIPEGAMEALKHGLSSPEKRLTVEEWIRLNAKRGEENFRADCERIVGRFEGEGVRALRTLEGIVCTE